MSNPFRFSSDLSETFSPLPIVLPVAAPQDEAMNRFMAHVNAPLVLATPTKELRPFDVMKELLDLSWNTDGDRPVVVVNWTKDGWDRLAYLWLKDMADQVKKTPKKVPRSMRQYANLMGKLTEHPTGTRADESRTIVLNRAIEQLTPGVRNEVERRIRSWSPAA